MYICDHMYFIYSANYNALSANDDEIVFLSKIHLYGSLKGVIYSIFFRFECCVILALKDG